MINFVITEVKYENYEAMIKDLVDVIEKSAKMQGSDIKQVYTDLGWYLDRDRVNISKKEFEELLITKGRYLEAKDKGGYNPYGIGSTPYGTSVTYASSSDRAAMKDSSGATL